MTKAYYIMLWGFTEMWNEWLIGLNSYNYYRFSMGRRRCHGIVSFFWRARYIQKERIDGSETERQAQGAVGG